MRRPAQAAVAITSGLVCLLIAAAPAVSRDAFLVPVSASSTGFGPYGERPGTGARQQLRGVFGVPSGVAREGKTGCLLRWPAIGVTVHLTTFGQKIDACSAGYFFNARLSDKRWHTSAGIRPGATESAARRASKQVCGDACAFPGYVLGLHPSDCAASKVPSVIAEVHDGKVVALRVLTHTCE
jgi:hypothetical protein